jgi:hypothetical protein
MFISDLGQRSTATKGPSALLPRDPTWRTGFRDFSFLRYNNPSVRPRERRRGTDNTAHHRAGGTLGEWRTGHSARSRDRTHYIIVCAQNRPPGDVPQRSSPTRASAHRHPKAPSFGHFRNVLSREIGFESRQLSWSTHRSLCRRGVGVVYVDPEGIAVMFGLAATKGKSSVDPGRFSFYDAAR